MPLASIGLIGSRVAEIEHNTNRGSLVKSGSFQAMHLVIRVKNRSFLAVIYNYLFEHDLFHIRADLYRLFQGGFDLFGR